ncbi:Preprotein translocase subunit SCY2 [Hibiscus syriacus]|uniref:Preprotein translocase subunit SCY2 n=1 Tax=Hibiscus syriacus TaxID=106335 RepID=A0A6A3AHZ0_HIBSY|nr:Preprotein translocase subunit SCY2 [Hibiscus syriacus]
MEATLLGSHCFNPSLLSTKSLKIPDRHVACDLRFYHPLHTRSYWTLKMKLVNSSRSHFVLPNRWLLSKTKRACLSNSSDQLRSDYVNVESSSSESLNVEFVPSSSDDGDDTPNYNVVNNIETSRVRPKYFRNRFLNFVRLSSVLNNATESFFKSEIRLRLFVTAVLLVISRVGYFIPLPGFDRRLIPQDYLSFVSGSVDDLGDFSAELKLSLFQLGISPQIIASIIMQVFCHIVPSLVKLRKEGLDGHGKIKSYMRV